MIVTNGISIDTFIKLLGAVSLVVGGAIGLWKYSDSVEIEFRKPFWERQISLYFDATSSAATLASNSEADALRDAEAQFWNLYYGPLALVEDRKVATAMINFGQCLKENCSQGELKNLSLSLARACRESISTSWSIDLEELPNR
jgi:hypothetical protein